MLAHLKITPVLITKIILIIWCFIIFAWPASWQWWRRLHTESAALGGRISQALHHTACFITFRVGVSKLCTYTETFSLLYAPSEILTLFWKMSWFCYRVLYIFLDFWEVLFWAFSEIWAYFWQLSEFWMFYDFLRFLIIQHKPPLPSDLILAFFSINGDTVAEIR